MQRVTSFAYFDYFVNSENKSKKNANIFSFYRWYCYNKGLSYFELSPKDVDFSNVYFNSDIEFHNFETLDLTGKTSKELGSDTFKHLDFMGKYKKESLSYTAQMNAYNIALGHSSEEEMRR